MLELGFFLLKERFQGNDAVVFHSHIKDELFLKPCINLAFKSLYFYYSNYSKVIAGSWPRAQHPRRHPRIPRVCTYKEFQKLKDVNNL